MLLHSQKSVLFKKQIWDSLKFETENSRTIKIAKHANVYTCGDKDEYIYFIEKGQIKLLMTSSGGNQCLLAIYTAGDVFGELCLCGLGERMETANAMQESFIKKIPCAKFFLRLKNDSLLEEFVKYLTMRIADQQDIITNLVTADSEQRLGKTLLILARKLGEPDPLSVIIKHKITHEELSEMVGTTRPRISEFMRRFRERNLIEMSSDRYIIVKEKNLTNYLNRLS